MLAQKYTLCATSFKNFPDKSCDLSPNGDLPALLQRLHSAPQLPQVYSTFWTPNEGTTGDKKRSAWCERGEILTPPPSWAHKNVYFGVNPSAVRRDDWQSSTNDTIGAVNCFLAEHDGKDFVEEAEWQPHYETPDWEAVAAATRLELATQSLPEKMLAQRVKGRQRGALIRAHNAAIDAAYKRDPALYKERALRHIEALPQRPTALWDSGGGYQSVWLFDKTIYLYDADGTQDADAYQRLRTLQRKWTAYVGGDRAASDLRRILRLPGSINFKPKYAPDYPVVSFLWCDLALEYDLDELAALLPAETTRRPRPRVHVPQGAPVELGQMGDVPALPRHSAIAHFNRITELRQQLLTYQYSDAAPGRMSRPGADSAGVELHDDNTATIFSSSDPLYCEHRITPAHVACVYDYGGDVPAFMASLPGVEATQATLDRYRRWLASPEALLALKEAGFKNPEKARKLLDAILQKCEEQGSLTIAPGYTYLSQQSTIAGGGLGLYLARLFDAGLINLKMGQKGGDATSIELLPNSVLRYMNSSAVNEEAIHVVQNWHVYREHRASEAFMNNHYAYSSTRTQATKPALGANGLGALLVLLDGPTTTEGAAAAVGYRYDAMARTLRRYAENGLVDVEVGARGLKIYSLKEEWREILKGNIPKMPTYGVQLGRQVAALRSREAHLLHQGESEHAHKVAREHKRMAALWAKVKAEAGIIPYVKPGQVNAAQPVRQRVHLSIDRSAFRARHRHVTAGAQWRRREYAKVRGVAQQHWEAFNAWAVVQYGPGWWVGLDQTDVLGRFHIFEFDRDRVPSVRWAGDAPRDQSKQAALFAA